MSRKTKTKPIRQLRSKEELRRIRAGWMLAFFGGLCGGLSFKPIGASFLIPLAPLLIFAAMRMAPTSGAAFRRALGGCWLFYFIAISWLTSLEKFNPIAPVGVVFLALYMAFYPALAAWAVKKWRGAASPLAQFALFAILWLLTDWFKSLGRLSMPFTQLGHALAPWPWAIQWADTFGEIGIGLQVLLFSAALLYATRWKLLHIPDPREAAWLASEARQRLGYDKPNAKTRMMIEWAANEDESWTKRDALILAALALAAFGMLGGSALKYRSWESKLAATPQDQTLAVAAVQPNIDQVTKMATNLEEDDAKREALLEQGNKTHMDLVRDAVPPETDLLVMPESTFSSFEFVFDEALHSRIVDMMRPLKADLLFGADRIHILNRAQNDYEAFNTAWFLRNGSPIAAAQHQDKVRLVPFGEYLPYFDKIPGFQETIVKIGSFTEGREMNLFTTRGHKFGALICFESTFSSQSREFARRGAEFFTIITNDAWYGLSAGPPQHHDLSRLRAVETRRPVVRCANTGISSLISPSGRATASLALDKKGVLTGRIAPQKGRTLFMLWGNTPLVLAAVASMLGILAATRRKQQPVFS